jgi:hypothetical protein
MKKDDLLDNIEVPAGLEAKLEALIDNLAGKERASAKKARRIRLWAVRIAASLALLISIGLYFHPEKKDNQQITCPSGAVINDPEIAYREAQKALILVSLNFNKGVNQLELATNEMEKANYKLTKLLN